jgi:hypothetical protein
MTLRYDVLPLKATLTADGYLVDAQALVARTGIQTYRNTDGTTRRELRIPEEVFHPDSLASFAGKPMTDDHPNEPVSAANFKKYAIGVVTSPAYADGESVRAAITIHDGVAVDKALKGGKRELSVGYSVKLDETPGEWNGQPYDAIQREIRVNHLSLVRHGRAGTARLNLDSGDAVSDFTSKEQQDMDKTMTQVKLDTGLTYDAAPEVAMELDRLRGDNGKHVQQAPALQTKLDTAQATIDALKAQVEGIPQIKTDALATAREEVKVRAELDKVATDFKVDGTGKTDREVKELVIKTIRTDADLTGKSDDYINAAFDIAVSMKADAAMAAQRLTGDRSDGDKVETNNYQSFMAKLGQKAEA